MEREERSVVFDRAIEYYDRTRGLTPEAMAGVIATLRDELSGRRTLEVGVGTGRIGVPLVEAGVDLVGLDLSMQMLSKLKEKGAGLPAVQGDATRMPWRDSSFERAIAVHVLHLIPAWRALLDDVRRVVAPGGAFIVNDTEDFGDMWSQITKRFRDAAGMATAFTGVTDLDEVADHLGAKATVGSLPETIEARTYTPVELIERLEQGLYSFTWRISGEERLAAGKEVRAWAEAEYGSLTVEIPSRYRIGWRVFRLA